MNNRSEVAALRARIDLEIEAMARLRTGFAVVASHEIISHRYNRLGALCEQLGQHVGSSEAYTWLVER
ncbi:MAG: hypothetical protein ACRDHW_02565, partial [Ktedonobacteraceae bacterium]